jgi:hypothetical protein
VTLRLIAPGLPEITDHDLAPETFPEPGERHSRIAGALGEYGWQRLCALHYALIGCGRTGSLLANTLVRSGVRRLTLVDPDHVEEHNLDGDGFRPEHVGRPKAQALAESLHTLNPRADIHALVGSVTEVAALSALKAADVLLCAVDHDGARWACGVLAALYLKPLLDVGTGVLPAEGDDLLLGADLRWIVPGEHCLLCLGSLAQEQHVAVVREGALREHAHRRHRRWQSERRGSLRSLNQAAVGLALRMLEDYLCTRLRGSLWLRLIYHGAIPELHRPSPASPGSHCLCQPCSIEEVRCMILPPLSLHIFVFGWLSGSGGIDNTIMKL